MKTLVLSAALLIGATAFAGAQERYRDDRGGDFGRERGDRGGEIGRDVTGVIGGALGAIVGTARERDGDCYVVIDRYRRPDGDIVERRHRECD